MEQRCQNLHPRKPGGCNYLLKAKGIGIITVECPRCRGSVEFNFVFRRNRGI